MLGCAFLTANKVICEHSAMRLGNKKSTFVFSKGINLKVIIIISYKLHPKIYLFIPLNEVIETCFVQNICYVYL